MKRLVMVLLVSVGFEATARAYIDPGTGSFALQALVGAALGVVFYFRRALSKLTSFVRRSGNPPKPLE
jgi:hypothetical protein